MSVEEEAVGGGCGGGGCHFQEAAHQLLLELHTALLASSALAFSQQAALRTAVLHLLGQPQPHAAAALVLGAAGSCALQSDQLQQQLATLINQRGLLDQLARLLPLRPVSNRNSSNSHTSTCSRSNGCRGTSSSPGGSSSEYASSILCGLQALAGQPGASVAVLQAFWADPRNQCALLCAACTGPEAAAAVARLAVAAASERALPAAALLQPLGCGRPAPHGTAAPPPQAGEWARTALQPLLDQVMQALQQEQQAAAERAKQQTIATAVPPMSTGQQQLWLLLCGCMEVAHQVGADLQIGNVAVFAGSLRAALLAPQLPALHHATLDAVMRAAIVSPQTLALACFGVLAPLMPGLVQQLMQQHHAEEQQPSTGTGGVGAQKLLGVWRLLLDRMASSQGRQLREAFVAAQLPDVVAALAAAAGDITNANEGGLQSLVAVFLAAAGSIGSHVQPLLRYSKHHRTLLTTVRPCAPALLHLVLRLSAAGLPGPDSQPSSSCGSGSKSGSSSDANARMLLVAAWLLHSSIGADGSGHGSAAVLEPRNHPPFAAVNSSSSSSSSSSNNNLGSAAAAAAAAAAPQACGEGCLVRLLPVVAGWLLQFGDPCDAAAAATRLQQVQAACLTLLHAVLAHQAQAVQLLGCSCATATASNSSNPAAAAAWQHVMLAMGACLERVECPASLLKRQVLQAVCRLLQAIALHMPQLLLLGSPPPQPGASPLAVAEQLTAAADNSSSREPSDLSPPVPQLRASAAPQAQAVLQHHLQLLQQLRQNLLMRKLERSGSGQELVDVVEQAAHTLHLVTRLEG